MIEHVLTARQVALDILFSVLYKKQNLDDTFDRLSENLNAKDKSFTRMLITTCLRRKGQIDGILSQLISNPLPPKARTVHNILCLAICQIIWMNVPSHAAVSTAVDLAKQNNLSFYSGLINAVLRNFLRQKEKLIECYNDEKINTPSWLLNDWEKSFGIDKVKQITKANINQPSTFVSVKEDIKYWEKELNGKINDTGSIELPPNVYIPNLPGFKEGAWWVQDAAAAIPVTLFDNLKGKYVADFCAAPGGKTAGLLAKGAKVDAFDISEKRLKRVDENLNRLNFSANLIAMDANLIEGNEIYDAILIDAPCSATGTIRRHPDLYFHRQKQDVENLTKAQLKLLKTAHRLVKSNGQVIYCTCSLQKEEGEDIIKSVKDLFDIIPITASNLKEYITPEGFIRTFPYQNKDGFFIAKLQKKQTD
jgi:16S rRNA (cytosine967-C5)-methyltransferase